MKDALLSEPVDTGVPVAYDGVAGCLSGNEDGARHTSASSLK